MQAPMTAQEVFDKVVNHLYTQGRPAKEDGKSCRYRGPNGTKCAVGCLIPDDEYRPIMEYKIVCSINRMIDQHLIEAPVTKKLIGEHENMLSDLQLVHDQFVKLNKDGTFNKIDLKKQLTEVAKRYKLQLNIPA